MTDTVLYSASREVVIVPFGVTTCSTEPGFISRTSKVARPAAGLDGPLTGDGGGDKGGAILFQLLDAPRTSTMKKWGSPASIGRESLS
jgi:hypothetical protein